MCKMITGTCCVVTGAGVGSLAGVLPWLYYRYAMAHDFNWYPFMVFTALACTGAVIGAVAGATCAFMKTVQKQ